MSRSIGEASVIGLTVASSIIWGQLAPPKVILVVGPPGSGKTTQSKFLSKKFRIPSFSMSDLLKANIPGKKDSVSKGLATGIASGDILPDDAANDLVKYHILRTDLSKGFIIDGYPATAGQAKGLDQILVEEQLPKPIVIVLEASDDVIRKRMLARHRVDDKPDIIDRRIKDFRNEAALLAGWYGHANYVRVDGNASIANVSSQILAGIDEVMSKRTFAQREPKQ